MSAKSDAAALVTSIFATGIRMPAPTGQTTKTINGKSRVVSAHEAWEHSSTDQTDAPTIKTFLNAIAEEFHKRGDPGRAAACLKQAAQF